MGAAIAQALFSSKRRAFSGHSFGDLVRTESTLSAPLRRDRRRSVLVVFAHDKVF